MKIDIEGKSKAHILVALYNASEPVALGILVHDDKPKLTIDEAEKLLENQTDFDYLYGHLLKVDLSGNTLETWRYNRDLGPGAAENALNAAGIL